MRKIIIALIACIASGNSYCKTEFTLEAGLSSYSFLTVGQDTKRNSVQSGAILIDRKVEADSSGLIAPSVGFTFDTDVTSSWSLVLSAWYLGQPKLNTSSTYRTGNGIQKSEGRIENHFSSLAMAASYRIPKYFNDTFLNIGYAHYFERHDGEILEVDIQNGQIRGFESKDYEYRNDEGHLTFGLTTFVYPDLQFRWQHLQSMYGPVQLFTLGLIF